jgi:hypothetical protein
MFVKLSGVTPKVLAVRPNLHNGMHASLIPDDNKQKDLDQVQILSQVLQLFPAGEKLIAPEIATQSFSVI